MYVPYVRGVLFTESNRLAGLMVKMFASRAADPELDSRLLRSDFSGWSHTSDLKVRTPVAILPGPWRRRVSAGLVGAGSVYCDWVR